MKINTLKSGVIALILFIISFSLYYRSTIRGTDVTRGSDFLTGFESENISKIEIKNKTKEIILNRRGNHFILHSEYGYPASNERINSFVFNMANIKIAEKVSDSEKSFKPYDVHEKAFNTLITFKDKNEKILTQFYVGKNEPQKGAYVRFAGKKEVYLTTEPVSLVSSRDDFINKNISSIKEEFISSIKVDTKSAFVINKNENSYIISKPKKINFSSNKVEGFVNQLKNLRFTDFKPINQLSIKSFSGRIETKLINSISYIFEFTKEKEKYYLKVKSSSEESPQQIVIDKNDDKEKLKNVEKTIMSQKSAQQFNLIHGAWIYEISKATFDSLNKNLTDLK